MSFLPTIGALILFLTSCGHSQAQSELKDLESTSKNKVTKLKGERENIKSSELKLLKVSRGKQKTFEEVLQQNILSRQEMSPENVINFRVSSCILSESEILKHYL